MRGRTAPFGMERARPSIPPPEALNWWWNPSRSGVALGPEWFRAKLHEVDPELEVTWNRYTERFLIWTKKERMQTKICSGWLLLFPVQYDDGSFMPLDERVIARLYHASSRKWGSGKAYFDAVEREMARDKERARKQADTDHIDQSMETYNFSQIKVSGFGPSSGSKFSTFHS